VNIWEPSRTPRVESAALSALLGFLLGPIGLWIVGFSRLAGVTFLGSLFIWLLGIAFVSFAPAVGLLLLLLFPLIQVAGYAWLGWYAYKRYESGDVPAVKETSGNLTAALAHYRHEFTSINYAFRAVTTANYDATMSMTLDSDFDRKRNSAILDTKKVAAVAFGVTDGRYYTTYFFTSPIHEASVQVSGVYLGGSASLMCADKDGASFHQRFTVSGVSPSQEEAVFIRPVIEYLMGQPPQGAAFWISEGWLLTETASETATIETAMSQWEFLNGLLDITEDEDTPILRDDPDCSPIDAARRLFPDI
jgi:hypothetical protein